MTTVMIRSLIGIGMGGLLASGCSRTTAVSLGETRQVRAAIPPDSVALYLTADKVPGKYEEVALVSSSGTATFTSDEKILRRMREKAGSVGANAIILDAVSEPPSGGLVSKITSLGTAERKGKAVA